MEAIKFENITKSFGKVLANKDISFSLEEGQIYSILKFTDNIIITGDHVGNLKQWTFDEESQKLNKTSFFKDKVHSSIIRYCLKIDNNSFATCSDDSYLKIWKI